MKNVAVTIVTLALVAMLLSFDVAVMVGSTFVLFFLRMNTGLLLVTSKESKPSCRAATLIASRVQVPTM